METDKNAVLLLTAPHLMWTCDHTHTHTERRRMIHSSTERAGVIHRDPSCGSDIKAGVATV